LESDAVAYSGLAIRRCDQIWGFRLDVINVKMHKLTIMPQILQPSKKAVKEKTAELYDTFDAIFDRFLAL